MAKNALNKLKFKPDMQASNFKVSENDRLPSLTSTKILGKRLFAYLEEKFVTALFCEFVSLSSFR